MEQESLQERIERLQVLSGEQVSTDTEQTPEQQPSTEGSSSEGIRSMETVYQYRIAEGRDPRRN